MKLFIPQIFPLRKAPLVSSLVFLILWILLFIPQASAANCARLARLTLPHGKITAATLEPAGSLTGETDQPIADLPSFCRVQATLTPSSDSNIKIELWMPAASWNGKYEGTGTGGYAGRINFLSLAAGLRRGYAVANTDMGTSVLLKANADALVGHPERWQDWGMRSTHEMTVAAKQIIRAFYRKDPARSYFLGCSTGGQQGLVEAQRFPEDYDGIVAGAPANNRTHLHMAFIWDQIAATEKPGSALTESKLSLITESILKACTAQKAVASDKFLSSPSGCSWDPNTIECKAADASDCLTAEQVLTVQKLYDGPRNPITHASIYPGLTRGSELRWNDLMPPSGEPIYDSLFKWAFGADWNWRSFDFNRDLIAVDTKLASILNATNPDLAIFKAHGHKLIVYHGWADAIVPSLESINYYQSVVEAQASRAATPHPAQTATTQSRAEETQSFYRLFMVPGMSHCSGGPGLTKIDDFEAIEQWVEKGIAPDKILAKRVENDRTEITRPVCAYPQTARYYGTGDTNDAANFFCSRSAQQDGK